MMLAKYTAALVALLHVYIMILEMFFWTKPMGLKAFGLKKDFADASKVLAANQGLYNGFLAAGIFYGIFVNNLEFVIFFLSCVVVAGIFGGFTSHRKILVIQAMPALVALFINLLVAR